MDRAIDAARSRRVGVWRADAGASAPDVALCEPDGLLQEVCPVAPQVAHDLWKVRPHLPPRIFPEGPGRVSSAWRRSENRCPALRSLYDWGNSLQVHRRLSPGQISGAKSVEETADTLRRLALISPIRISQIRSRRGCV